MNCMPLALILTTLVQSLEEDEYVAQMLCIILCLDKCNQIESHNEFVSFHLFFKLLYSLKGKYFSEIPSNLYDSVIFLWNLSRALLEGNSTQLREITNFSEIQGGGERFQPYCSFPILTFCCKNHLRHHCREKNTSEIHYRQVKEKENLL